MEQEPFHGRISSVFDWVQPNKILHCEKTARPGYNSCLSHEYEDLPNVFDEKVTLLADMIRRSEHMIAYTGAGLSTSSGIGDYASRASKGNTVEAAINPYEAKPSAGHKCLVQLYFQGFLKWWCQQNHDGLPQKAGW